MMKSVIDEGLKIKDIRYQVMNYIRENLPVYKMWSDNNLEDLIKFYMGLGQFLVSEKDGKINGILAFQFINTLEERNTMVNDRKSDGAFIDMFIAATQAIREKLIEEAVMLSGVRKWIAFERCKYSQRVSKLPWKLAERIACYGRR
ncbi:MAG: hypothetical protein EBS60_01950 [Verrucomicrobia bacterium]|nr:hypothetical protein [Verrucomicrobiota bacterium]NBS86832.1 hypothetical protein [Verrucomicrobiota bacterium]